MPLSARNFRNVFRRRFMARSLRPSVSGPASHLFSVWKVRSAKVWRMFASCRAARRSIFSPGCPRALGASPLRAATKIVMVVFNSILRFGDGMGERLALNKQLKRMQRQRTVRRCFWSSTRPPSACEGHVHFVLKTAKEMALRSQNIQNPAFNISLRHIPR